MSGGYYYTKGGNAYLGSAEDSSRQRFSLIDVGNGIGSVDVLLALLDGSVGGVCSIRLEVVDCPCSLVPGVTECLL